MDFDTRPLMDYIIPDSTSDFGAILLWVLLIVLVIMVIIDIRTYLFYRKTSKTIEKPQQNLNTTEKMKKTKEERIKELDDIRNKVDKIIEINKL